MLNKAIRIALSALLFIGSIFLFIDGQIGNGIMVLLLMAIVITTYFRNERILLAFWYLRKQNNEKAKKILSGIKSPEASLTKGNLAYFYFLNGILESQTGMGKAETLLKKALNTGLRMKHDQAMAKLSLAGIAMAKRRKREAQILLTDAKKLDDKGMLADQIKMMKQQMKKI